MPGGFKSGERNNKKMMNLTAEMSDAGMADLAAYYATLK
jgi:cytochrome c553